MHETKSSYPLGPELRTLSEDLESQTYTDVVKTMIYQDLKEEWKRVATPDNSLVFLEKHGGLEIKSAYQNRKQIADRFIAFMEKSIRKKNREPNFNTDQIELLLLSQISSSAFIEDLEDITSLPRDCIAWYKINLLYSVRYTRTFEATVIHGSCIIQN